MKDEPGLTDLRHLLAEHFLPLLEEVRGLRVCSSVLKENIEASDGFQLSERFLQIVWNEQRLRGELRTTDGQLVEVLSSGLWNVEAGPDFKGAMLRIDGQTLTGDIEVHRVPGDWLAHGHHLDPLYRNVVLHVVWRAASGVGGEGCLPPCLEIAGRLDRPWLTLLYELQAETYPYARQVAPGLCAVQWAMADDERLVRLLRVAGLARFEDKTVRLARAIVAKGASQALHEALFEALGYKANRDAFRRLAQHVPLDELRRHAQPQVWEALLFGRAGLLPDPSQTRVADGWADQLHNLWDAWWRQGSEPLALRWVRAGSRPFNSPERRLAAGVEVLRAAQLAPDKWLLDTASTCGSPHGLLRELSRVLTVASPWEHYKDFAVRLQRPVRLLGPDRVRDLVVNVALPFLNAMARRTGHTRLAEHVLGAYLLAPSLQGNRLLGEAVHRFLVPPSRGRVLLRGACQQQGLIETFRSFCLALHNDCKNCPFGGFPVDHPSSSH